MLLLGPPGVGETHRAGAIGREAIVAGHAGAPVPPRLGPRVKDFHLQAGHVRHTRKGGPSDRPFLWSPAFPRLHAIFSALGSPASRKEAIKTLPSSEARKASFPAINSLRFAKAFATSFSTSARNSLHLSQSNSL
jgi:hypothetical protein